MNNNDWGFWAFVATALNALVAFLQWRAIHRTADLTDASVKKTGEAVAAANRNATAAFKSAEAASSSVELMRGQVEILRSQLKAAEDTAIAAKDNATAALSSARIATDSLETNKVIERAYVKISHEWPEGATSVLDFLVPTDPMYPQSLGCHITVKNEGHTPADVLGGRLWAYVGRMSERPTRIPIPTDAPFMVEPVFLTGGGGDFIRTRAILRLQRVYQGQGDQLWVLGYVDYRDRFKEFHRTGYCRHFVNGDLVFDQTTSGLNYDIEIDEKGDPK